MEDYKDRLKLEITELIIKYNSLKHFMDSKMFYELPRNKKTLLYKQFRIMNKYIEILGERMELEEIDDFYDGILGTNVCGCEDCE